MCGQFKRYYSVGPFFANTGKWIKYSQGSKKTGISREVASTSKSYGSFNHLLSILLYRRYERLLEVPQMVFVIADNIAKEYWQAQPSQVLIYT